MANNKSQKFIDQVLKQATDIVQEAYSDGPQFNLVLPSSGFLDLNASRNSEIHELQKEKLHKQGVKKVFSSEKNLPNVKN